MWNVNKKGQLAIKNPDDTQVHDPLCNFEEWLKIVNPKIKPSHVLRLWRPIWLVHSQSATNYKVNQAVTSKITMYSVGSLVAPLTRMLHGLNSFNT